MIIALRKGYRLIKIMEQIKHFGIDYFDEMLERIREIRLSERRLYQKIIFLISTERLIKLLA